MLEGLDRVDWAALRHAYGLATDVPQWLRALRSPDPEVRQWAREYWNIVHQGTRYAATAPAVPFLVELTLAADTPARHWLVWLLTYAAIGYDTASLPDGIVEATLDQLARTTLTPNPERDDPGTDYPGWALAAYQAVQAAVPSLLGLLDHDDVRLRRATAHLLAWFPHWAPASLPLLRARLGAEPDSDAKATMVVAVGLLAGGRGETSDRPRLEALLGDADVVVRWAAAVALARLFPQAPPEPAVAELLGWLTGVTTAGRRPAILFPQPEWYAMVVVRAVPALRERVAAEALLARLPALSGQAADSLVANLIRLAFGAERPQREVAFADLPPLQQRVLRALLEMPGLWHAEAGLLSPLGPLLIDWEMSSQRLCTLEELREQLRTYVDT
ncbi:MAG TPA: HEAT repeat domain-containing protein [Actinomycetes bacterium]